MLRSLFLSAFVAGTFAAAAPAFAADADMPPDFRSSTFDVYIGTFGTVNSIRSSFSDVDDDLSGKLNGSNYGMGFRVGSDYIMGDWVVGAVGDWAFGSTLADDSATGSNTTMQNLLTLRARAGINLGSALIYATGGYAQAEMEYSINNEDLDINASDSGWTSGWTIGAGVDLALTDAVSVGLEYLYVDLSNMDYSFDETEFKQDIDSIQSVRLGVNYAFSI